MKKDKTNKKMSGGEKVAIGAGLAALGAGAYYLMGPKSKAHQKKAKALYAKVKTEVKKEIKRAETASAPLRQAAEKSFADLKKKAV